MQDPPSAGVAAREAGAQTPEVSSIRSSLEVAPWGSRRLAAISTAVGALIIAWGALAALAMSLLAREPSAAGFDLQLILDAAQRVREGLGPYDPSALIGPSAKALDLFYSYPPVVAQVASLLPPVGVATALAGLWVAAAAAWAIVAWVLVTRGYADGWRSDPRAVAVLASVAILPVLMPAAIGLLFGNLDVLFIAGYGAVVAAFLVPRRARWLAVAAGVGLGAMVLIKVYPAAFALWLVVAGLRSRRDRRPSDVWVVVGAAAATFAVAVGVSLVGWGVQPWLDYADVVRAASQADVVVRPNVAPAALVAGWLGLGQSAVPALQVIIIAAATAASALAGWTHRDGAFAACVAAIASLVVLPVTWLHYPAALVVFGFTAQLRAIGTDAARSVSRVLLLSVTAAVASVAIPAVIWVAVALLVVAVARSASTGPAAA